jgi:hypothetical protein
VPSRLAQLARGAPPPHAERPVAQRVDPGEAAAPPEERCDLCGEPVPPGHRHLVDVSNRRLMCACRACTLLFDRPAAGGGHLRLVPTRRRRLEGFRLDDAAWDALRIPVEMAFFFESSAAGHVIAVYPSPMGATESLLELEAWDDIAAANPVLAELAPDVEALLVSRARGMRRRDRREHWRVPIDDCYELVGLIRSRWKGLGGGDEVWDEIARFFDDLPRREEARW